MLTGYSNDGTLFRGFLLKMNHLIHHKNEPSLQTGCSEKITIPRKVITAYLFDSISLLFEMVRTLKDCQVPRNTVMST